MLRINRNSLKLKNELFYFNNDIFSGLSYCFDEKGKFEAQLIIKEGIIQGESDDLLPLPKNSEGRYDADFEDDSEYTFNEDMVYYNSILFTGVQYTFTLEGVLELEDQHEMGELCSNHRRWYLDGKIREIKTHKTYTQWYQNGLIFMEKLYGKNGPGNGNSYSFTLEKDNTLSDLYLADSYLFEFNKIESCSIDKNLELMAPGITDNILDILLNKKNFERLNHLELIKTSVTGNKILSIEFKNLSEIIFNKNPNITKEDMQAFQDQHPNCQVIDAYERMKKIEKESEQMNKIYD